jgi:hypothetical protein
MPDYPAHQSLKTRDRDVYCSRNVVRNHDEGRAWVAGCMAHFGIKQGDLRSVTLLESCPVGATIWP